MSDVTVYPPWITATPAVPALLTGIPAATLLQWLTDAQTAYHLLLTSNAPQTVTYGQGDGQKSVTFNRSSAGQLNSYILMLQQALGLIPGRRAIGVRFRR